MTPLAHEIVKDSLLPVGRRRFDPIAKITRPIDDLHFFETSAVAEPARILGSDLVRRRMIGALAFLPAPRTWIEFRGQPGERHKRAAALLDQEDRNLASVKTVYWDHDGMIYCNPSPVLMLPLIGSENVGRYFHGPSATSQSYEPALGGVAAWLYGYLAMINTPRVILSRQHMPHAGLQRQLIAARKIAGKYPLLAWSEVLLKVRPPDIPEEEREAHLTGAKALHFCRQHLRIRLGRLELVSAHWRGDPALGIKQTRYRLVA